MKLICTHPPSLGIHNFLLDFTEFNVVHLLLQCVTHTTRSLEFFFSFFKISISVNFLLYSALLLDSKKVFITLYRFAISIILLYYCWYYFFFCAPLLTSLFFAAGSCCYCLILFFGLNRLSKYFASDYYHI